MRKKYLFIFILTTFFVLLDSSCTKDEFGSFTKEVSFDVTARLLEGSKINCIDVDSRGNYCIGSEKELYYSINGKNETRTLDYNILDVAIASDGTVWVGTDGGGLGHLSGNQSRWYTKANSGLPRDHIRHVEIAPDGTVWFTSCAHRLGGLGIFDGVRFEFMTPENSSLNQNVIEDINIDRDGSVYIATSGTVGRSNIYRIKDRKLECLGDEEGMFYWIFSFTVSPSGTLYVLEDFSLSSYCCRPNNLYEFTNNRWQKINADDIVPISFFARIKADQRGYCWVPCYDGDTPVLYVYDGKRWIRSPKDIIPAVYITCIEVDDMNNIWLGTWSDGVFVLRQ